MNGIRFENEQPDADEDATRRTARKPRVGRKMLTDARKVDVGIGGMDRKEGEVS